jgi:hypothetical protein
VRGYAVQVHDECPREEGVMMGLIKDAKASAIAEDAKKRRVAGGRVFFARINLPMTHHAMSGGIDDFAVQIEAVEDQGWRLDLMSVTQDSKGRPEGYFLFRAA